MSLRSTSDADRLVDIKPPPTSSISSKSAIACSAPLQNLDATVFGVRSRDRPGMVKGSAALEQNAANAPPHTDKSDGHVPSVPSERHSDSEGTKLPAHQLSRTRTILIMVSLCSAVFLAAMDITITTVAVPAISGEFNSTAGYTWIGSAYLLASAATAPSWGKISDIWGRKPVLLTVAAVFWIGSLIAGTAANMTMLIVARALQGVGGGGLLILVNICISDLFSMRKRGFYLGISSLVWALAGGFGPVLGGVFTSKVTWRWCFYINLPFASCAIVVLFFSLKLHNPRTGVKEGLAAVDWLGSLWIVGGTLMILLGLEFGGISFPWKSPTVICLLVFGVIMIGLFFVIELKVAKYPVIPLRVFKKPCNLAVVNLCVCHGFVFISASYYLPLYFQGVLGADALMSGVYVLPLTFVTGAAAAASGFYIRKTGKYRPPIIAGFVLMTLGYGLFIDLDPYANWPKIIIYQLILGLGIGPNFQSPLIALQATVPTHEIASATATYGFTRQVSTSISVIIGGVIFQNEMQKQYPTLLKKVGAEVADLLTGSNAASSVSAVAALPEPQRRIAQDAYFVALRTMFIVYVGFAGLGLVVSFFVGSRKLSHEHKEHRTGLTSLRPDRTLLKDEEKTAG